MKKALKVFLPLYICLLLVVFLPSCSDSSHDSIETSTEPPVAEQVYKTSGECNDTVKWKYDASTSTFCYYGTGKITNADGIVEKGESHWAKIAEHVRFEEGITDAEDDVFWIFNKIKSFNIPASYIGTLPKTEYIEIEKYIVAENNQKYSSDEHGVIFNKEKTELIRFPSSSHLEFYEIPEGVTTINSNAFNESKNLKSVTVPKSIDGISVGTFEESSIFSNPDNWVGGAFYVGDCLVKVDSETKAEHITVKEGTRRIEAHAFARCTNIKSIVIPDSVIIIGNQAFESCTSLEYIHIGSGVDSIGLAPFVFEIEGNPCSSLKSIEVSKDNQKYTSVDGVLFSKDMTKLIQYPIGKNQKEYVIPDSVTALGYGAFCYCDELEKLTIGKGITEIDYCVLFDCDNIETVILPDTLTKIDGGAFKYSGIKYIDIPDSVTYLGIEAMAGCERLEVIKIGKGVTKIEVSAICADSLKEIKVNPENQHFSSDDGILYNKNKSELIMYPKNKSGDTYHIPDSVTTIKGGAILSTDNLKQIYVPKNVKRIENDNFYSISFEDDETYSTTTPFEIFYSGTERQWNSLFIDEYSRDQIDKSKIYFS